MFGCVHVPKDLMASARLTIVAALSSSLLQGCAALRAAPSVALRTQPWRSVSPRCQAADDAEPSAANVEAAQNMLRSPRPSQGFEAFSGTAWQVLLEVDEGGVTMYTVELMEDARCRFSDKDEYGAQRRGMDANGPAMPIPQTCPCVAREHARLRPPHPAGGWKAEKDYVVFDKPRGLFEQTLYHSAQLQLPTPEQPKMRLVNGVVHATEAVEGSDPNDPNPQCVQTQVPARVRQQRAQPSR